MEYLNNSQLLAFSQDIEASREDLNELPFFSGVKPVDQINELEILRRWNSHTPMLYDVLGGGYFLRWQGKGIVIDPGCTFVSVFRRTHPTVNVKAHCMNDIDLVVVTHDHIDHCEELSTLLTILRAFNKWRNRGKDPEIDKLDSHKIDLVMSYGVYFKCHALLDHKENRNLLRACCKVSAKRNITPKRDYIDLKQEYKLDLECLETRHKEVIGDESGFGLKLYLYYDTKKFIICDTGDTAYDEEFIPQYDGADLLILHVGTLEKLPEEAGTGHNEHLCFRGVVNILKKLKKKPKLILLGEWGQEFGIPGYRKRFTEFVKQYAGMTSPILPIDLGMRIRIPDCHVWCNNGGKNKKGGFVTPSNIKVVDVGQRLNYLKI